MALPRVSGGSLTPQQFGAVGDGVSDDTVAMQAALTFVSDNALTLQIPAASSFLLTQPVFLWVDADLQGGGGEILFDGSHGEPYLFCFGVSAKGNAPETPWSGTISGVRFEIVAGAAGRGLFFFRTMDAQLIGNIFDAGASRYSCTSRPTS